MRFIGVSTASSSIMKIFQSWSNTLNLNAVIKGIDIPMNASKGYYVCYDSDEVSLQITSLQERAEAINNSANGLKIYL
jgi:hypothetical protein